ncbi:MAG: DUF6526 family protein [Longimicrobiales bacterium]
MSESPQSFENHAKFVPGYHQWTTALLFFPLLWFGYRAVSDPGIDRVALFVFSIGVLLAGYWLRAFPLGVQDRVIRLEERLRMERILPADLRARVPELTAKQLVALRFASDEELPELTRRTLANEFAKPKDIKRAIKGWRADHQRI